MTLPPLWTSSDLAQATNGAASRPFTATGVSIDTRTLRQGDLFIALQGTADGHAHVQAAFEKGAAAVLVSKPTDSTTPTLLVQDTLQALTAIGTAARARFHRRVIAVTGSVGKTTTKEMLRTALTAFGPTHAAEASYNNHWGVPLTLARLPAEAAFCVLEIGMNNPGEILPLARLAAPHIAIITAIASAHIGHLGSLEAIAAEKATLLDALAPTGTAIIPADTLFEKTLRAQAPGAVLTVGLEPTADIYPTHLDYTPTGTAIRATIAGHEIAFTLPVPGRHMALNALATLAAIHALGLEPTRAAQALQDFTAIQGRGQQRRLPNDVLLLDESYNASSASVRAALEVRHLTPAIRRLAVLGDMLELGPFAEQEHVGLARDVANTADLLYACGPHSRTLFDRIPLPQQGTHTDSAETLAPILAAAVRPGDAVLIKGSLGSRMRLVVQALEASLKAPGAHV